MKKKAIVYAAGTAAPTVALAVALYLLKQETAYIVCYAMLCAGACWLVASSVWHTVRKDWSVKVICSKVWAFIALSAWTGCILTGSWDIFTALVGIVAVGAVNSLGFRWLGGDDSAIFKNKKVEKLAETMLFELDQDGNANHNKPLCVVDGHPVTPAVALEKGFTEMAENAVAYIKTIV